MPFGGEFGDYAMRRALRRIVDVHKKMKGDGIVSKTIGAAADYAEGQLGNGSGGQPAAQASVAQQAQTGTSGGAGQANPEQRAVSLLTDLIPAPPRPGEEDWLFQRNMLLGG